MIAKYAAKIGDAMLAKAAPQSRASAGCPSETFYQYRCASNERLYRRRCTTSGNCTTTCGTWVYISQCP